MAVPLIEIRNASKTFGGVVRFLDNVSIKVNEREMVGVLGKWRWQDNFDENNGWRSSV